MKWPCSIIMQITCLLNNIPPISVNKKQLHAITESENCNHWVHTFGTSIIPSLIILCRPPIATYGVCRPYEYTFFLFTEHFYSGPTLQGSGLCVQTLPILRMGKWFNYLTAMSLVLWQTTPVMLATTYQGTWPGSVSVWVWWQCGQGRPPPVNVSEKMCYAHIIHTRLGWKLGQYKRTPTTSVIIGKWKDYSYYIHCNKLCGSSHDSPGSHRHASSVQVINHESGRDDLHHMYELT